MSSYVEKLKDKIHPPKWLPSNVVFEGLTGSVAYGMSANHSDEDIVGFCIPPKEVLFPHLAGEIFGFGTNAPRFEQFQQHHIQANDKEYDLTIYSIVKAFQLMMENNPNMVEMLFLPRRCVLHSTPIYEMIREHRHTFLHLGSFHKFKGYAMSQMAKIKGKVNSSNPKRAASVEKYGFDTKFAAHLCRLLLEVEQIMVECDLDLERNSKFLIGIRNGEWTLDRIIQWQTEKELELEKLYHSSTLRKKPDEPAVKRILTDSLEMHYGDLSMVVKRDTVDGSLLKELNTLVQRYT